MPEEEAGATFSQAVFSVLNILMGVGLLSIPLALTKSGWAGLLVLWLLGLVTNYTGKALCRCSRTIAEREGRAIEDIKYEDIAGAAFGEAGRRAVAAVMYTELIGTCALLLILEGDNLWNLLGSRIAADASAAVVVASALVVPTVWAPNVASLSFLGLCGFAATLTVSAVLAFTLATGNYAPGATTALVEWGTMPLIFGIMAFVYAGHAVFPAIQASMREPERFPAVLNAAYGIVAALCTFLGAAGYYMYGAGALDVITFNLRGGAAKTLCAALILINPVAKFALTMEPVAINVREAVFGRLGIKPAYIHRFAINTAIAVAIVVLARYLPYLSLVMSLIGSFMTLSISVIFPAAANYMIHAGELPPAERAWIVAVVVVGVVCALSGTASALLAIQAKL